MKRSAPRGAIDSVGLPLSSLNLRPADLQLLMRLQEAGVIQLEGLTVPAVDARLIDWTYDAFLDHMVSVQHLTARALHGRRSTAVARLGYVRFLENHPVVPVQLRPPTEASWIEHVSHRRQEEGLAGTALNQYRKALVSLLRFLHLPPWDSLKSTYPETAPFWVLPPDDTVPLFWTRPEHEDPYLRGFLRHAFHFGFHAGLRPPSEILAMNLGDVDVDSGHVTITEVKKGGKKRVVPDLPEFVVTGRTSASLKNYVDHWRPRVDSGKSDAFFLDHNGQRWDTVRLGSLLSEAGKRIWSPFVPYTMRRWHATMFLIENGMNVYLTAQRLGDTVATVERHYVDHARVRAEVHGTRFRRRFARNE